MSAEDRPTFQVRPSLQRALIGIKLDHLIEEVDGLEALPLFDGHLCCIEGIMILKMVVHKCKVFL